jgi:predicted transcriptional regulator
METLKRIAAISLRLPEELLKQVDNLAKEQERSRCWTIVRMLREVVDRRSAAKSGYAGTAGVWK